MKRATVKAIASLEDMWSAVDAAKARNRGAVLTERPVNCFTSREYRIKYRVGRKTADEQLERMLQLNQVSKALVWLPNSVGAVVVTRVFIPRKGA